MVKRLSQGLSAECFTIWKYVSLSPLAELVEAKGTR